MLKIKLKLLKKELLVRIQNFEELLMIYLRRKKFFLQTIKVMCKFFNYYKTYINKIYQYILVRDIQMLLPKESILKILMNLKLFCKPLLTTKNILNNVIKNWPK